jgi:hypothetical protein
MDASNFDLAFDEGLFLVRYRTLYPHSSQEPNKTAREIYESDAHARSISPNAQFDEIWYRHHYPDVAGAIAAGEQLSGFSHFCEHGHAEGRMPSEWWMISQSGRVKSTSLSGPTTAHPELRGDVEAMALMAAMPFIDVALFLRHYGMQRQQLYARKADPVASMAAEFDPEFYVGQLEGWVDKPNPTAAFRHYMSVGASQGLSPNKDFDERFYATYYKDVGDAIAAGILRCGFHHYMSSGRSEGRLPMHDPSAVLERALPGITSPDLLRRATDLEKRIAVPRVVVRRAASPTFWIFVPRFDPDFTYAGYRALFELIVAIHGHGDLSGHRLHIVVTENVAANLGYFLHRTKDPRLAAALSSAGISSLPSLTEMVVSPDDYFLAYSSWDAYAASQIASRTRNPRILQLVQEYEPIFYDHNSFHAMVDGGFRLPSFPLFNSAHLASHFRRNGLGLFADHPDAEEGADYLSFSHVITPAKCATAADMASRKVRTCLVYARPERHASRNLFEIALLALRRACQQGAFDDGWRFVGVGTMGTSESVPLANGQVLELWPKMSEAEYTQLLTSTDLGISFMYAPHPSVVPYELCSAGAVVVTNCYGQRDPAYFAAISSNFVTCRPTIDSAAEAIVAAVGRTNDHQARVANAYRPKQTKWAEVFDGRFIQTCIRGITGDRSLDRRSPESHCGKGAASRLN